MTSKYLQRQGCFWLAIGLLLLFGRPGSSQDIIIPKAAKSERDLIRDAPVGSVPRNKNYSTDLFQGVPLGDLPRPKSPPPGMVEEILRLRAADRDAPVDPVEEAEFAAALRKLVAQKQKQANAPLLRSMPVPAKQHPEEESVAQPTSLQLQLRQSALHMEGVAARLESAGDYAGADKARAAAVQLWHEARKVGE